MSIVSTVSSVSKVQMVSIISIVSIVSMVSTVSIVRMVQKYRGANDYNNPQFTALLSSQLIFLFAGGADHRKHCYPNSVNLCIYLLHELYV